MKSKLPFILLIASLICHGAAAQKVEKKIIHAKTSVDVYLDKATSDKFTGHDKDRLLDFINKTGVPEITKVAKFNSWWKAPLTKKLLKKQAIFAFINIDPNLTDKISALEAIKKDIEASTAVIFNEIEKYKNTPMAYLSAQMAIGNIDKELARIKQESLWGPYQEIRANIVSRIDATKGMGFTDKAVDAISEYIQTLVAVRDFKISQYEMLHNLIYRPTDKARTVILHSMDGKEWDDDPVGCDKILIVLIDGTGKLAAASFYAENFKSAVVQEFNDLVKLVKDAGIVGMGAEGTVPLATMTAKVTFMELQKSKITPPGNVVGLFPIEDKFGKVTSDTVKLKIKEKIHLGFRVGVANALIDRKLFKIDNRQLVIRLDSANKEEWKQHLVVTFNLNPWYRTGDYSPEMFKYNKDNNFFRRLSVFTGMNLSLTPLDNLYLGAAYDLSKNFTINAGATWNNTLQSGRIDIGDISSIKDALKLSNKKYGDTKWFFALTFRPAVISELLGLNKEEE